MPVIELKPEPDEKEEQFYRKHIIEALGEEEGKNYLAQQEATRKKYKKGGDENDKAADTRGL